MLIHLADRLNTRSRLWVHQPRSHVHISEIRPRPVIFDWAFEAPELHPELDDACSPTGIDRETVDVHGWLRSEVG